MLARRSPGPILLNGPIASVAWLPAVSDHLAELLEEVVAHACLEDHGVHEPSAVRSAPKEGVSGLAHRVCSEDCEQSGDLEACDSVCQVWPGLGQVGGLSSGMGPRSRPSLMSNPWSSPAVSMAGPPWAFQCWSGPCCPYRPGLHRPLHPRQWACSWRACNSQIYDAIVFSASGRHTWAAWA